jgi:hypothetical protein
VDRALVRRFRGVSRSGPRPLNSALAAVSGQMEPLASLPFGLEGDCDQPILLKLDLGAVKCTQFADEMPTPGE